MDAGTTRARRWLITGASSGMGRQLAERALHGGDEVVAAVRRPRALEDLQQRHGSTLTVEQLDVRDLASIDTVVTRVAAAGSLDVLVNNAGYSVIGALEELSEQEIADQLATLLHGPILLTRAALPALRRSRGRVLQISSMGGQTAFPGSSIYHAAKWGLEGFTESVAAEVAPFGVRCTLVEPGSIRTGFGRAMQFAAEAEAYRGGPVGAFRTFLRTAGEDVFGGDPVKVAAVLFQVTQMADPPSRLALGGDAVDAIAQALADRQDELRKFDDISRSIALGAPAIG